MYLKIVLILVVILAPASRSGTAGETCHPQQHLGALRSCLTKVCVGGGVDKLQPEFLGFGALKRCCWGLSPRLLGAPWDPG